MGGTLNFDVSSQIGGKFEGIWGNRGIYHILEGRSMGSKGFIMPL